MTKRLSLAELPRKYQGQAAAQMWKGACKPVFEDMPAKAAPVRFTGIRQKAGDGLNKLERDFLGWLERNDGAFNRVLAQSLTLKLANGVRYTPDFVLTGGCPKHADHPAGALGHPLAGL